MKHLRIWGIIFVFTTLTYGVLELRSGLFTAPFSPRNYLIIGLIAAIAAFTHREQMGNRSAAAYGKFLLTGDTGKPGRIIYMDWLRVLAAVLVIALHCFRATAERLPSRELSYEILSQASALLGVCNVLFVLISGALILNGKEEPIGAFYFRKLRTVFIPCFLYYLFYCFYYLGIHSIYPSGWPNLIRQFASNSAGFTPHFWLIHVILLFYIAAPFLACMTRQMKDSTALSMAFVILLCHTYFLYGPSVHMGYVSTTFLAAWDAVFLLGYFCTTEIASRYYRLIAAMALASLGFVFFAVHNITGYERLVYNNAPPMLLLGCTLFLFFRKHGDTLFRKIPSLLSVFGKYSFSILLIHWLVMFEIVENRLGISGAMFGDGLGLLIGIPLEILATLFVSTLFAILFDNTVVLCADKILRWGRSLFVTNLL